MITTPTDRAITSPPVGDLESPKSGSSGFHFHRLLPTPS